MDDVLFIESLLQWVCVATAIGIYAIVVIVPNMLLRLLHRIANKPFISKVITLLKANMVCVIFLATIGVLCSVCGEDSSVLNAPVLRRIIREVRHHEYTGE
jgi:hypothetical protein